MTERPIMFSAPMIKAIVAGRKSQTRRIIKPQPVLGAHQEPIRPEPRGERGWVWMACGDRPDYQFATNDWRAPYAVGDRLWVRENFSGPHRLRNYPPKEWMVENLMLVPPLWYWDDGSPTDGDWTKPKPSIHMPRWASRITLDVTNIRVERLQDISEEDAWAEGVADFAEHIDRPGAWEGLKDEDRRGITRATYGIAVKAFQHLWETINGATAWEANPWVVAVSFERLAPEARVPVEERR